MVKSYTTRALILLLICFAGFSLVKHTSSSFAATACPPNSGSNFGGNWAESNFQALRDRSNCDGPIDVNVIFDVSDLTQKDPTSGKTRVQQIIELAQKYNFNLTLRAWGNAQDYDPVLHPDLSASLQQLSNQRVYFGNEQNDCSNEPCPNGTKPDPAAIARTYQNLLNAGININIVLPALNMQSDNTATSQKWQEYMDTFIQNCPSCLAKVNYAAINAYTTATDPASVDGWVNQVETYYNYLRAHGFQGQLIVAEAGVNPGAFKGKSFAERVQATLAFAQALEARLSTDPALNSLIAHLTFFLMDESTGKQYLVFRSCDASGVCTWKVVEYLTYNELLPGFLTPTPTPLPFVCSASNETPGPFRPAPCKDCGYPIEEPVNSCANAFTAMQDTYFYYNEEDSSKSQVQVCDKATDNQYAFFTRSWNGNADGKGGAGILIDIDNTKVPFAGYRDKLENMEEKYLAQYFTGSLVNNGPKYAVNTRDYALEMENEAGVMSKIFSLDQLDAIRCKRITTAQIDPNENYLVPFKSNSNLPASKRLTEFAASPNNMVPCNRPILSQSADPAGWQEWEDKMAIWQKTDYGKLWPFIPLTTLKDAPGSLALDVQSPPGSLAPNYIRLSFPHLGSLYQASQNVWDLLSPQFSQGSAFPTTTDNTTESTLADARDPQTAQLDQELAQSQSYCGLKQELQSLVQPQVILAQTSTPSTWYNIQINPGIKSLGNGQYELDWSALLGKNNDFRAPDGNDCSSCDATHIGIRVTAQGTTYDSVEAFDIGGGGIGFANGSTLAYNEASLRALTVEAGPGGQITFTFQILSDAATGWAQSHGEYDPKNGPMITMTCNIKADGTIDQTTCISTIVTPTPSNKCNNPDTHMPNYCQRDAISDINPNDVICSAPYPINVTLTVNGYRATFTRSQFNKLDHDVSSCVSEIRGKDYCDEDSDKYDSGKCHDEQEKCRWQPYTEYSDGQKLSRMVGLTTQIPYTEKIRDYTIGTADNANGVFDIFRPSFLNRFDINKDAKTDIGYAYHGTGSDSQAPSDLGKDESKLIQSSSQAVKSSGDFYYPYLGGVEMAKQCVSTTILRPQVGWNEVVTDPNCPSFK
jgi:hypothetical protein